MPQRFGGLNALCHEWKRQFDAVPPGSQQAVVMLDVVVRLAEAADASRPQFDPSMASNEELDRRLKMYEERDAAKRQRAAEQRAVQ